MSQRILFGDALQERLNGILFDAGFRLVEDSVEPFEFFVYKRPNSRADNPDEITFHGIEGDYQNWIKAFAVSFTENKKYTLRTLKELLPNYLMLKGFERKRWLFDDLQQLNKCLSEITDIVENRLLAWFDNPVNNPADEDRTPKLKLSDEQLKAKLIEMIDYSEARLKNGIDSGDENIIMREKIILKEYRLQLAEIEERLASDE